MEVRTFDYQSHQVSVIGQGTWYANDDGRAPAIAALRRGIALGMTHIDTAEMYGSGTAEETVAEAIAGQRDQVFLVSKVLPENASRRGTILPSERSLARLRTDRLDCCLLHWRARYPLEETGAAFTQLERDGKILSWAVSISLAACQRCRQPMRMRRRTSQRKPEKNIIEPKRLAQA